MLFCSIIAKTIQICVVLIRRLNFKNLMKTFSSDNLGEAKYITELHGLQTRMHTNEMGNPFKSKAVFPHSFVNNATTSISTPFTATYLTKIYIPDKCELQRTTNINEKYNYVGVGFLFILSIIRSFPKSNIGNSIWVI